MNALAALISRAGHEFASADAVVGEGRSLTFADVEAESNRLASALVESFGLAKGDRVAILLGNRPEFVVADFALIKAGLIRVPINPRYAAPEIEYIVAHSGAAALVTSAAFAGVVAPICPALGSLRTVIAVDALGGVADAIEWRVALARGSAETFAVDTDDDDGYMIGYTSGTTGRPKGAFTTVAARWAGIFNTYANELFVTSNDAMLHVASLAHGSGTKVLPHFAKGAKNVLTSKFSPADFFRLVDAHQITTSWMVPTMVAMLADSPERDRYDLRSLSTVMYAGAPMPEPVMQRALGAFGPIFVQIYGLTEAPQPDLVLAKHEHFSGMSAAGPPQGANCPEARSAEGSPVPAVRSVTGRAAVGVGVRLVDASGRDVAEGEVGEIILAGAHCMARYWNDPEATAEVLRDGWCYTGDLARVDAEGFYTIVDRRKEMIITGGYNVYPREVEDVLYRHPTVAECAVVGTPDATWGECVHALVVAKPGCTIVADELSAHCARSLAGYKKPRRVTVLAELPKTANGKIDKKALRARYAQATASPQPEAIA